MSDSAGDSTAAIVAAPAAPAPAAPALSGAVPSVTGPVTLIPSAVRNDAKAPAASAAGVNDRGR